jgi:DegV family protein with EDD domain
MKLFADSCSDISLDELKSRDIDVLPLTITIDDKNYLDQIEISSEEVLEAISNGKRPLTSQANPEAFVEAFRPYVEKDEDIIYIAFSSELSGTYNSAVIAKETLLEAYPEASITVIDTKAASYGLGMIIESASDDIEAGRTKDEVIKNIEYNVDHMIHLFTVSDLDYLAKGGRLSKGQAFLGGLLNIKPLLHVEDGKLVPIEKHRGIKKVLASIVKHVNKDRGAYKARITHSNAETLAEEIKAKIIAETAIDEVAISMIGPTISSHTGNGTVALFYYKNDED